MKGIILAGGLGTRLYPITHVVSKQLLPVYDKPMVYYPISILMRSGIKEILIISSPNDIENYMKLLGDGKKIGVNFSYIIQPKPEGLAQAFILGEDFIGDDSVCLILGDNIFYGHGLENIIENAKSNIKNNFSTIFAYNVSDPERYGVVEFDDLSKNVISIEEKPKNPKSNFAVVGLYFYTNDVVKIAKTVRPSKRGELEITSVNQKYLKMSKLKVQIMKKGFAWLDTGTHDSLNEATNFVRAIEKRQGLKVACLEEIAFQMNFIDKTKYNDLVVGYEGSDYGNYLKNRFKQ